MFTGNSQPLVNKGNPQNSNYHYTQNTPNGQFQQTYTSNQQTSPGGGFQFQQQTYQATNQASYAQRIESMHNQIFDQHLPPKNNNFQNQFSPMQNQYPTGFPQQQQQQNYGNNFSTHLPNQAFQASPSNQQYGTPYGTPNQQQYQYSPSFNQGHPTSFPQNSPYSTPTQQYGGNTQQYGSNTPYGGQSKPVLEPVQYFQQQQQQQPQQPYGYGFQQPYGDNMGMSMGTSMGFSRTKRRKEKKNPGSNIPFNLQRANFTHQYLYEEPTVKPEEIKPTPTDNININNQAEDPHNQHDLPGLMRISLIQSSFINNPYHQDHSPKVEVEKPVVPKVDPEKEKEEENRRKKAFAFFTQSMNDFSQYVMLLGKLKTSGEQYTDEDFPPNDKSLMGTNLMRKSEWGHCVWLRPDEFYGKGNYQVFVDKIEPDDIKQGELGDCYFLSTLASLAEWPKRIQKIFASRQANGCGCYCVKVCDMGEWKDVIIDDYFPCSKYTKKPLFTRGNDNELWVLILEKVWAKIYGNYDNIEAGLTRECLHDLTGAPTKFFLTDRPEEWDIIWRKLLKAEAKDYAMTAGAGDFFSTQGGNMANSKGIVSSHAYSLLSAHEFVHQGKTIKLVKLRNPWGKTEWKGDWGDSSPIWTPELKKKMNVVEKDDGDFFMPYQEFLKYFSDVQFCKIRDDYVYNSHRVASDPNHAVYFKFNVTKEGKYYITVNQESKRKNSHIPGFKYSTVSLVITRNNGNGKYEHYTGNNRADKEVWAKAFFIPGEYLVYAKVQWNSNKRTDFVISSYGPENVKFEVIQKRDYPNLLEETFITKGKESTKKMNYAREGEADCFSVIDIARDGFIYCYYENNSRRTLETEVYFKEFKGIKLRKPYRGREFKIRVPPGSEKIVLLRILPNQDVKQVLGEKVRFVTDTAPSSSGNTGGYSAPSYGVPSNNTANTANVPNMDNEAKDYGDMKRVKDSNGNFTQIYIYQYRHDDGYYLMFENKTSDLVLDQRVLCDLQALEPMGMEGKRDISFQLYPGNKHRIAFQKKGGAFNARFDFHSTVKRA